MRYIKFKLFAFVAAVTVILSCTVDEGESYCFSSAYSAITEVSGNDTISVLEPLVLDVSFKIPNSCGRFNSFAVSNGYPKDIAALVNYEGCKCTEEITSHTKPYTFTANAPGQYVLRFLSGNNMYITKTITVTE